MAGELVPIIIIPALFYCIGYITRVISDNRIRRELLNNQATEDIIEKLFLANRAEAISTNLKWGIVLIALGLSLALIQLTGLDGEEPLTYGLVFIFGGVGLLIYYAIKTRYGDASDV